MSYRKYLEFDGRGSYAPPESPDRCLYCYNDQNMWWQSYCSSCLEKHAEAEREGRADKFEIPEHIKVANILKYGPMPT